MSTVPLISRGKFKFKGDKNGTKRNPAKKRELEVNIVEENKLSKNVDSIETDEYLTAAQKRHMLKKREMEAKEVKLVTETTYRNRIEDFNMKLATMTEHNDIPRISAAGNG